MRRRLLLALLVVAAPLAAQTPQISAMDFPVGGELENYLRLEQLSGKAPYSPWSIRGFSARELSRMIDGDSSGPWKLRNAWKKEGTTAAPIIVGATLNTSYPYGANDGPVWKGRGLTLAASGGFGGRKGGLSFALNPLAFIAQNASFTLVPNGQTGSHVYKNAAFPEAIDLPQRFGPHAYGRVDPGNSYVRFDSRYVSTGFSTANEWIGPATEYPFILGNNAAGFPHLFLGTGDGINLGIMRAHARVSWGKLFQSAYSPVSGSARYFNDSLPGTVRLASSAQFVIEPRGVPGLEIGVARFFHVPYAVGEPRGKFWIKPLRLFFLKNEYASGDTTGADNQLASAFFRWVFPHSGFEFYGERGYEDQFYDRRDLLEDIDHEREYMLGMQKILRSDAARMDVLSGELVNYQLPGLARVREENGNYLHGTLRQGHTYLGQLLAGINDGACCAASVLSWKRYTPSGRTSWTLRRIVRAENGNYQKTGVENRASTDVIAALGYERMRFGTKIDWTMKAEGMQDFNRNFKKDTPNLSLEVSARIHR